MGIIRRKPSGGYEYTEEFLRHWLTQGGLEREHVA
jgi:hypothetical protein